MELQPRWPPGLQRPGSLDQPGRVQSGSPGAAASPNSSFLFCKTESPAWHSLVTRAMPEQRPGLCSLRPQRLWGTLRRCLSFPFLCHLSVPLCAQEAGLGLTQAPKPFARSWWAGRPCPAPLRGSGWPWPACSGRGLSSRARISCHCSFSSGAGRAWRFRIRIRIRGSQLPPGGPVTMPGDVVGCPSPRGGLYWHLASGAQGCC